MTIRDILFGKPLPTWDERAEELGTGTGIPIFGLDALSSAAYGPEAALTLLIVLGAAGIAYIVPISASIIVLLALFFFLTGRRLPHIRAVAAPIPSLRKTSARLRDCSPRRR